MRFFGTTPIPAITHPEYAGLLDDWKLWRLAYSGGAEFVNAYVEKFSTREADKDFVRRKRLTPTTVFAKTSVDEIKNSIFERLNDVTRQGGSQTYLRAVLGHDGGVDRRGSTMNWFIGHQILPDLLTMKRVGVFVDNYVEGPTKAGRSGQHPYFYTYRTEDIRSWQYSGNRLINVLLRDHVYALDEDTGLPLREVVEFRHLRLTQDGVKVNFYDEHGALIPARSTILNLPEIPFEIFEITESLLKNVASHQVALVNLESSDISYILYSNYPLYTEQSDGGQTGAIRSAQRAYREEFGSSNLVTKNGVTTENNSFDLSLPGCTPDFIEGDSILVGATQGRRYGKDLERPAFIAPPTEPVRASMEKQENLKNDIRKLVHLALSSVQSKMASAESKKVDQQGLEAGLAYIGLELEHGERGLARHWANYESQKEISTVLYPEHWSLKSADEIAREVKELREIREEVPSLTFKTEVNKRIASMILGARISNRILDKITIEIDQAPIQTSNPTVIQEDVKAGLLSGETASKARAYPSGEFERAKKEHAERLARIANAQSDPAARGVPDLGADLDAGSKEKINKPKRGEADD